MALHRMTRATIPDRLQSAKEAAVEQFLRMTDVAEAAAFAVSVHPLDNVVGIGIGRKLVNGRSTGTPAVRFYVERKVAKGTLPTAHRRESHRGTCRERGNVTQWTSKP